MNVDIDTEQRQWQARGEAVGRAWATDTGPAALVRHAADEGIWSSEALVLVSHAVAGAACESAPAALILALHAACLMSVEPSPSRNRLSRGEYAGALTLATDEVPDEQDARLFGRASWVAPLSAQGVALVAARRQSELVACEIDLGASGLLASPVAVSGLRNVPIGHLAFDGVSCRVIGATQPVMIRARILIAAVGLGIARRAVREALVAARGTSRGAGGEQTVQGLIADAAVDLDAAAMLTWKAALSTPSLAAASMAKLSATVAAQRAVERAAQVVGAESFREGHILGTLTQDVRALELFAGRTEALRDAVALEHL